MNNLLNAFKDCIHAVRRDYADVDELRSQGLKNKPLLYVPAWRVNDDTHLEIIVYKFFAVIAQDQLRRTVITRRISEHNGAVDPFTLLDHFDKAWRKSVPMEEAFYFGLLAYELAEWTEGVQGNNPFYNLAQFFLVIPADCLIIDHSRKTIVNLDCKQALAWPSHLQSPKSRSGPLRCSLNESREHYLRKIESIRKLILDGEVYQLNYTLRLTAPAVNSGLQFFKDLYTRNPAPFSFYLNMGEAEIISNSPERFLSQKGGNIFTQPIKGTIRTAEDPVADLELKKELLSSAKESAELSMIVDLLRNDMSRVSVPGSVKVEAHRELKTYTNVHHLVSTVRAQLEKGNSYTDLLRACFPGGSISGCPKNAALKYIRQFERHERSFYTGSMFLRFPGTDRFDSSILIRTAIRQAGKLHFGVGGGIVIDSEPEREYEECMVKAASFLKATGVQDDSI